MGDLLNRIKLGLLVNGDGVSDNFKNNSLFFYEKYQKSDDYVKNINIRDIQLGGFYFLTYQDTSNWMRFSPVFIVSYKKYNNSIILFAINLNFIPLEIRAGIFDKYLTDKDIDNNQLLKVDYNGVYEELRRWGFEYSLMEFNASQILLAHKIDLLLIDRFLYHQHPINTYDPKKLMQIWQKKIETRDRRHAEMSTLLMSDLFSINSEISDKFSVLKDHIKRFKNNII